MRKIWLCGHTGSENRGCDAIVRSTVGILKALGEQNICVMTFAQDQDRFLGLNEVVELVPYPKKTIIIKVLGKLLRELFHNGVWGQKYYYRTLAKEAGQEDLVFNIGGDTYCYGTPYISYALNEVAEKAGIPTVFWGCSVDERPLQDEKMQRDINRYACIVARETMSYEVLCACTEWKDNVYLTCDPAFTLEPIKTALPDGFLPGQTVGINLSPLVFTDSENETDMMYLNTYSLIESILANTQMSVCLIPHVYHVERNTGDIRILRKIYDKYKTNPRVSLVERELNSQQLKYIISQCRFFIGARTHSMIAAYSSGIPGLALSYSVKSLGLAKDIFGSAEPYAVSWKSLSSPAQIAELFENVLMEREAWMRQRLQSVVPAYCAQIMEVTQKVLRKSQVD